LVTKKREVQFFPSFDTPWVCILDSELSTPLPPNFWYLHTHFLHIERGNIENPEGACKIQGREKYFSKKKSAMGLPIGL
jgi:hypothetical protein